MSPDFFDTQHLTIARFTPDWALIVETTNKDKLYLVRETKSAIDKNNLRQAENIKILCSKKHFAAINVNFDVATNFEEVIKKLAREN